MEQTTTRPQIVIIGGGFGGLTLTKRLAGADVDITLIDRNNYHTFQPLLYQVATSGLAPDSIAGQFRKMFKNQTNVKYRMAEVLSIDAESKTVKTSIGGFGYDYLVIATGSTNNFFGNANYEQNSMPVKSIADSLNLRSWILQELEKAVYMNDIDAKQRCMNFVVAGGGPAGVEMAGALCEFRKYILPLDYPELKDCVMQVYLIEGMGRLLNVMSEQASAKSYKYLEQMGVNIMLNTMVEDYDGETVKLKGGDTIATHTFIWSAGVMGSTVEGISKESIAPGNRYVVDNYNRVKNYDNVFAIGDCAAMINETYQRGHPMVAPVAVQQGEALAKNIIATIGGKPLIAFDYRYKGSMATVGKNKAVADLPQLKFQGWFAWILWMYVHLLQLIGFRNKFVVFIDWMWNYLTYERSFRLIIRPFKKTSCRTCLK